MGPGYLDRTNRIAPLIWAAWLRAKAKNPEGWKYSLFDLTPTATSPETGHLEVGVLLPSCRSAFANPRKDVSEEEAVYAGGWSSGHLINANSSDEN